MFHDYPYAGETMCLMTLQVLLQSWTTPVQAKMGVQQWCAKYDEFESVAALVSTANNSNIDGKMKDL